MTVSGSCWRNCVHFPDFRTQSAVLHYSYSLSSQLYIYLFLRYFNINYVAYTCFYMSTKRLSTCYPLPKQNKPKSWYLPATAPHQGRAAGSAVRVSAPGPADLCAPPITRACVRCNHTPRALTTPIDQLLLPDPVLAVSISPVQRARPRTQRRPK